MELRGPGIYSEGVAQRGRRQPLSSRPSYIPGPPAAAGALPTCRLNEPIVTSPRFAGKPGVRAAGEPHTVPRPEGRARPARPPPAPVRAQQVEG